MWICNILFICSPVDGHRDCFTILAIVNDAAINMYTSFCVEVLFHFSWVEIWECSGWVKGSFMVTFLRNYETVFQSDWAISSPTAFQFSHTVVSTCYCLSFCSQPFSWVCAVASHCGFNLRFPNDEWAWPSLHELISHLYFIFRNV